MDRTRPIDSVAFGVGFCDLDRCSIFLSREPTSRRGQPCTALHPQASWSQRLLFLGPQLMSASIRFDFQAGVSSSVLVRKTCYNKVAYLSWNLSGGPIGLDALFMRRMLTTVIYVAGNFHFSGWPAFCGASTRD